MKILDFVKEMREVEISDDNMLGLENFEEFKEDVIKFWDEKNFEDRDIVLEDLKCNEGILYLKMIEWNDVLNKYDSGFSCWDYSLEDFFRDCFDKNGEYNTFKLFSIREINKMMYFEK